jgi:hypothetical protein
MNFGVSASLNILDLTPPHFLNWCFIAQNPKFTIIMSAGKIIIYTIIKKLYIVVSINMLIMSR